MNDNRQREDLIKIVQHNCHLSDAHHARDYSLCIYLLKMREFYRWEQGIAYGEPLPKHELGEWLTEREQHWEEIYDGELIDIVHQNTRFTPLESEAVNQTIATDSLVYSGGYFGAKPHFFLAELESVEEENGARIYIAGHELAREITAPPAMTLGDTIFLRRESLQRMIWEKLEEWGWQDPERAIARASAIYNFEHDLQHSLESMAQNELDTLRQHELGELQLGKELGEKWEKMLSSLPRSRVEFYLRAVRDHLVDCLYTLPWLLEEQRNAAIHFYFANFTTLRRAIFPELETAYLKWVDGDNGKALRETIKKGADSWFKEAQLALTLFDKFGENNKSLFKQLNIELTHLKEKAR